jgi:group I intron endonuclease
MFYIYKTTNLLNKKIYVGQSKYDDPTYFGSGIFIKKALEKYGIQNFYKEILEKCDSQTKANEREKFWIKKLESKKREIGYNIADGGSSFIMNDEIAQKISETLSGKYTGENSFRAGIKLTDEHKKSISKANSGKIVSTDTRKKISESRKGIVFSEESKKKMSISHSSKKLTTEHKINISKSLEGRKHTEETKNLLKDKNLNKTQKNSVIVYATSLFSGENIIFNNLSQASRYFNCTRQRIKNNGIENWRFEIRN